MIYGLRSGWTRLGKRLVHSDLPHVSTCAKYLWIGTQMNFERRFVGVQPDCPAELRLGDLKDVAAHEIQCQLIPVVAQTRMGAQDVLSNLLVIFGQFAWSPRFAVVSSLLHGCDSSAAGVVATMLASSE